MRLVTVSQYDPAADGTLQPHLLAQLQVSETGIERQAGEETETKMVLGIPVIDPESGEQVRSDTDPLRWADLLPTAFRSGAIGATVEEIKAPMSGDADVEEADVEEEDRVEQPHENFAVAAFRTVLPFHKHKG